MWRGAVGTTAPVHDLRLVDDETAVVGRCQAGRLADGAVDVGDGPAGPADDVVVVVADPRLVAGNGAGWLNPAHEPRGGHGVQHVVHGLSGDPLQDRAYCPEDRLRIGVRTYMHRLQHRDPGAGHAKFSTTQQLCVIRHRRHSHTMTYFSGLNPDFAKINLAAPAYSPEVDAGRPDFRRRGQGSAAERGRAVGVPREVALRPAVDVEVDVAV